MSLIIKKSMIINDNWLIIKNVNKNMIIPKGKIIVHLNIWKKYFFFLKERKKIGIWIFSYENFDKFKENILKFTIIAINFPIFFDGRGYTLAYKIRNYFNYCGELRAFGNILCDQIFYLKRVGFNSFCLENKKNYYDALDSLNDFSINYQSSFKKKKPLFVKKKRKFKK